MAREHIVDLDEQYLDQMERFVESGISYLGAYGRVLHQQNEDDNFRLEHPDFFEGGTPPELADRSDHNSSHHDKE